MSDLPVVVKKLGLFGFLKRIWQQMSEDAVFTWAAALAYSWMFAVFPFLIFLLSLVPLLPDQSKTQVQDDVTNFVETSLPKEAAEVVMVPIRDFLDPKAERSARSLLSFGLLITIWAASGGMAMTMTALDKAYDIEQGRSYIKQRAIALLLTIVTASSIILVLVLLPIGTLVLKWVAGWGGIFSWLTPVVNVVRYIVALSLLTGLLAMIYYMGPSFKHKFQAITPGALFCVAVWLLLGFAFKIYVTRFGGAESYAKTYGAIAGAAILLLVFYLDALVLLIGAEINSEIDFAVLGIPSGNTPEGQTVARTETALEPEQQELARELLEKRHKPDAPPAPGGG